MDGASLSLLLPAIDDSDHFVAQFTDRSGDMLNVILLYPTDRSFLLRLIVYALPIRFA